MHQLWVFGLPRVFSRIPVIHPQNVPNAEQGFAQEADRVSRLPLLGQRSWRLHLPMQKFEKISPRRSSLLTSPVIAPRKVWTRRRSSATSSRCKHSQTPKIALSRDSWAFDKAVRCRSLALKFPSPELWYPASSVR